MPIVIEVGLLSPYKGSYGLQFISLVPTQKLCPWWHEMSRLSSLSLSFLQPCEPLSACVCSVQVALSSLTRAMAPCAQGIETMFVG